MHRVRAALTAVDGKTGMPADGGELRAALREASAILRGLPRRAVKSLADDEVRSVVRAVATAGAGECGVSDHDLAEAAAAVGEGPGGLLAAMVLVPSWQLAEPPALESVPDWLWGDYVGWLFAPARGPWDRELVRRVAARRLPHLEELSRWVARNFGSATVRAAMEAYCSALAQGSCPDTGGRRTAQLRAGILTQLVTNREDRVYEPPVFAREGRPLRVGIIGRDFGPSSATYGALAGFERLDPQRFDVMLFPLQASETAESQHCGRRAKAQPTLPSALADQVRRLRKAALDVIVFCGDVGGRFDGLTRLALHRIAPLQVANHRTGFTSGLPEIDLCVSAGAGSATNGEFSERVGLLGGPQCAFSFPTQAKAGALPGDRGRLGLPAAAFILSTVVASAGPGPDTCRAWAAILARVPGSRLIVASISRGDGDGSALARLCASFEAAFRAAGVDTSRITVFPVAPSSSEQRRAILGAADLFVDSTYGTEAAWVAEALSIGLPALVSGNPSDPRADDGPAWMVRSAGLPDLIADSEAAYVGAGVAFAADAGWRAVILARLGAALEQGPAFLDSLAASDAFGAMLETAFDELAALGRTAFRDGREPLRCYRTEKLEEELDEGFRAHAAGDSVTASYMARLGLHADPSSPRVRYLCGALLLAEGRHERAAAYLTAALPRYGKDVEFLLLLVHALELGNRIPQALKVLEACVRIGGEKVDTLLILITLSERIGCSRIARETLERLRQIAPDDHRVLALS